MNMTRQYLKPINQKKYSYSDEPNGNDENRGAWPQNIIALYATPRPEGKFDI